jgi:hypothetical protein
VLSLAAKGPKGEVNYLQGWEIEKRKSKGNRTRKERERKGKEELEKVKGW